MTEPDVEYVNVENQYIYVVCYNDLPMYFTSTREEAEEFINDYFDDEIAANNDIFRQEYFTRVVNDKMVLFRRRTEWCFGFYEEPIFNMSIYQVRRA